MTRYLAGSGIAQCLLGLAILVMAGQAAIAQTTTLACRSSNNGSLGPDLFELNESQGSVTIAFAAAQNNDGSVSPARSSGPLSATFTDNSITVSHDHRYYGYSSTDTGIIDAYVINRLTATVELTSLYNNGVVGHAEWTCRPGKKQF